MAIVFEYVKKRSLKYQNIFFLILSGQKPLGLNLKCIIRKMSLAMNLTKISKQNAIHIMQLALFFFKSINT
jgi:hypothetical protein